MPTEGGGSTLVVPIDLSEIGAEAGSRSSRSSPSDLTAR